ncbi:AAA family ATPase [Streptacidiphilus sp. 4-A2]|nr:AAA family ATPase [Streptacidiphilus sp. 4-A2]
MDELDARLHPRLAAKIVSLFQDGRSNPNGAQLLFNTHDATLLAPTSDARLRRDQVWLTDKGADGGTSLTPLLDFRPRRDGASNLERGYLAGRYGGLPFFDEDLLSSLLSAVGAASVKSRPSDRPLRRARATKAEKQRFLVYCEGANTEEIYLRGIKRELRDRPIDIVIGPADGEPMTLVRDAIKHRDRVAKDSEERFDHVWCLFDVEAPKPFSRPHGRLEEAVTAAGRAGIGCALSNPCFELWLILHFQDCAVPGLTNDRAAETLARLLLGYHPKGGKRFEYSTLEAGRDLAGARARALHAGHARDHPECRVNPCTSVPELLAALGL